MTILGTVASSTRQGLSTTSFESIASVTLTSAASTITFSSIPSTYQHLHVRGVTQDAATNYNGGVLYIGFNNDTSTSNYFAQSLNFYSGTGQGVRSQSEYGNPAIYTVIEPGVVGSDKIWAAFEMNIPDYTNTSKAKSIQGTGGYNNYDIGQYGYFYHVTGVWNSTAAVSTITFTNSQGNFNPHTRIALYGIKAVS